MEIEELQNKLADLNRFLATKNLRPEEYDAAVELRNTLAVRVHTERLKILKNRAWQEAERRNSDIFMGEKLVGGPRNIPGSQGGGVEVLPEEAPETYIRGFVPNTSYGDPMIMSPDRLRQWRYRGI